MTIAVSAVIRPSRLSLILILLFAFNLCLTAVLLFHRLESFLGFIQRLTVAVVCVIPVFALLISVFRSRNIVRIDISGNGQIRLFHTKRSAHTFQFQNNFEIGRNDYEIVRLLGDSTLWPYYLSLRLQSNTGKIFVVSIFPDSVEQSLYRSLLVALRCLKKQDDRELMLP